MGVRLRLQYVEHKLRIFYTKRVMEILIYIVNVIDNL
jgi:hypothetical protein